MCTNTSGAWSPSARSVPTPRSFDSALKNALRQKPDVILVGEIRDAGMMRHALNIAETGHLALATLHANNADQAIERIVNFFALEERRQVLLNLSFNSGRILSQRLVRRKDGGRTAALEIMLNRGEVTRLIRSGDTRGSSARSRPTAVSACRPSTSTWPGCGRRARSRISSPLPRLTTVRPWKGSSGRRPKPDLR